MTAVGQRPIANFRDLRVWQESVELVKAIYAVSADFPREELYGLSSQMKRAAVSVASNIAEGHARSHRAEYRQSVFVAVGSLAELETQLHIAGELGLLSREVSTPVQSKIDHVRAMLLSLGKRLSQ